MLYGVGGDILYLHPVTITPLTGIEHRVIIAHDLAYHQRASCFKALLKGYVPIVAVFKTGSGLQAFGKVSGFIPSHGHIA